MVLNFDGDTHKPLEKFNFDIARAVHLQLVVSPTMYPEYIKQGIRNVAYWPIGIESEYLDQKPTLRYLDYRETDSDVVFMGLRYGEGKFWEAENRRDSVARLWQLAKKEGFKFDVYGRNWESLGVKATATNEQHAVNAKIYSRAKMALSISQASHLWGYTSDRLYNITATGCPALVHRFAGMEEHGYVDGETCIVWKDIDEMVEKVMYYLEHDDEREAIGVAGRVMTHARHTWDHRIQSLLVMLDGMEVG